MKVLEPNVQAEEQPTRDVERCLQLQVFIRGDSTLCQDALKYAETLVERHEGICIDVIDTLANKKALDRYWQLVRQFGVEKPRVPMFFACGQLKVGFSREAKSATGIEDLFAIHAYIRPTCQHCRDANRFLTGLAQRWKGVRLIFHDVDREPREIQEMNTLARQHGIMAPSFPVIYVCGRVISGYRTDATTGRQIEDLLVKASVTETDVKQVVPRRKQVQTSLDHFPWPVAWESRVSASHIGVGAAVAFAAQKTAPPAQAALNTPQKFESELPPIDEEGSTEKTYAAPAESPEGIELPWIGYVRVRDLGLPAFTLLIGLIDGFNPCAMWVLVFLLSVLVNVKDRRKIAAIAGTFVVVSGLAYFAFMAAWLSVFTLVGLSRPLQIGLGVLAVLIGLINIV
ncbi:MAG: glutaredoxin domain-containing protein [Pirellulales bacterium]